MKQRRQINETKTADKRNKTNGIVGRYQWNRSTISMESSNKTNGIVSAFYQKTCAKLVV